MPSIDQVKYQEGAAAAEEAPVNEQDVELLVRTGIKLLRDNGGLQIIKEAIDTSQDPAQVIGQFLAQMVGKMGEEMGEQLNLDPRAFLAKGGFVEGILDYIEGQLGLPTEFSDQVFSEVVEVIKAAAQDPEPPNDVMGPGAQGAAPVQLEPGLQGGPPPPSQGVPF